ncbi:PREDICTED: uncharacterized protein LOC109220653 [Nicotiana attenuata]|uniref:uncharacterized protein LOC109220653 n=1 Tax=Nicotiana attenuata TaxID=49451 RepID=UPI000905BDD9|nr:PREDICTED: uncharacterized protein LOC109220653 [Nicotiana attenuata]
MGRHTVQKSAGVLELDVVSALSAQISTLTNQVNQMTLIINKQQAQPVQQVQVFCEICGEGHTSDLCPANPEFVCFVGNANRGQTNQPATTGSTSEKSKESEKPAGEAVAEQPPPLVARPPPPFPHRLQKVKDNAAYKKFLDILKQVQIYIPLVDILQEVLKYAKYIMDIVANKRRLTEFETVAFTEESSSRIQGKKLGLGEPRPTIVILQLADRSLAHLEGVIEYVLVQVGSFIFPADFIILDYEPDQEVPFILGRPFLATGRAIIDVCEGRMTMRLGDRVEVFNVYKALKLPAHYEELSMISVVESDATSLVPYMSPIDPLERALIGDEEDSKD